MKIHILILSSLVVLSGLIATAQPKPPTNMELGLQAYRLSQYPQAIGYFTQASYENPTPQGVFEYLGFLHFISGDYAQADRNYSRAIEMSLMSQSTPVTGSYKMGNMTVIEPGQSGGATFSLASLYNNRGVTRYLTGRTQEALLDFNQSLSLDPSLQTAGQNRNNAQQNPNGQLVQGNGPRIDQPRISNQPNTRGYNAFSRPVSTPKPLSESVRKTSVDLREERIEDYNLKAQGKPAKGFTSRRIPKKGRTYHSPAFEAASENYLTLESITITDDATLVTITVENPEGKSFQVNIGNPGQDDAYVLTDRSGKRRFVLRKVTEGISRYPASTELIPKGKVTYVLEFEKLADDIGYVNIFEGNKLDGWNFFMVDLTR